MLQSLKIVLPDSRLWRPLGQSWIRKSDMISRLHPLYKCMHVIYGKFEIIILDFRCGLVSKIFWLILDFTTVNYYMYVWYRDLILIKSPLWWRSGDVCRLNWLKAYSQEYGWQIYLNNVVMSLWEDTDLGGVPCVWPDLI